MGNSVSSIKNINFEDIINNYKHGSGWGKDKDE